MTINTYPADLAGQTAAFATPEPRSIVYEGGKYIVRTDKDYEAPPAEVSAIKQELAANPALDALAASVAKSRNITKAALVAELEAESAAKEIEARG